MDIPKEFFVLGGQLHQDSVEGEFDEKQWVDQALRGLSEKERHLLRSFLDDVLGRDLPDAELQDLWAKSGSDFFIYGPDGVRSFFQIVRGKL